MSRRLPWSLEETWAVCEEHGDEEDGVATMAIRLMGSMSSC